MMANMSRQVVPERDGNAYTASFQCRNISLKELLVKHSYQMNMSFNNSESQLHAAIH